MSKDTPDRSTRPKTEEPAELPRKALVLMAIGAFLLGLWSLTGSVPSMAGAAVVLLTDGIMALLVLLAAGGYGYAVYRRFAPAHTPPLLALATSAALGLWLLGSAVLIVGSAVSGALSPYVWWPVVAGGVALALGQAHRTMAKVRLPGKYRGGSLIWVLVAAGAGMCLAGAALPPGWVGGLTADSYDVREYHLQLPREFHHAGRITTLDHNVYSHYPLGVEMLYLLGMCLRGGSHQGVYLAKLMNGLFAIIAAVGIFGALRRDDDFRARAAMGLVISAPWALYFCWIAMVEIAQFCYLALVLVWLRQWLRRGGGREALWLGAMAGGACAVKYLSVGLITGPVLAVMLLAGLRRPKRLGQTVLAAAASMVLFAPWLVRNYAATGNPVFPLAISVFGQGHWTDESARRWYDGHSPALPKIIPPRKQSTTAPTTRPAEPPQPPRELTRREAVGRLLTANPPYNGQPTLDPAHLLVGISLAALLAMFIRPKRTEPWDWALAGVIVLQFIVWSRYAHEMPARFISISAVPLALLAAGGLARLARVRELRLGWYKQTGGIGGRWGAAPAGLLLVAAMLMNFNSAREYFRVDVGSSALARKEPPPTGWPVPAPTMPEGTMLVGLATPFNLPASTRYATVFDTHPLERLLADAPSIEVLARRLRKMDVTHVYVDWAEIRRFTNTYGWPDSLAEPRLRKLLADWPVVKQYPPTTSTQPGAPPAGSRVTLFAVPDPDAPATQPTK